MKTLHVTIRLGVVDDDGAFDKYDAQALHRALCRAFPLCLGDAIEVTAIDETGEFRVATTALWRRLIAAREHVYDAAKAGRLFDALRELLLEELDDRADSEGQS